MGKNTAYNHRQNVKRQYDEMWNRIIQGKLNFDQYLELRTNIFASNSYKRLRKGDQEYFSGYDQGIYVTVNRYMIEWRLYDAEGNLILTNAKGEGVNYKFDYSVCQKRESEGKSIGEHVWKDTDGKSIWSSPKKVTV